MQSSTNGEAKDLMSAYLDEQLDADETAAFEDYLAERPDAREELEELRRVMALVSKLPSVEASPEFFDDLSRKLRRRQRNEQVDGGRLALVALPFQVLSILVILAVAALYMMAQLDQEPQGGLEHDPVVQDPRSDEPAGPSPVLP
jgi:anti-sigma factor RsiW